MTPESAALRQSIRDGLIGAHVARPEFEWAVARVYEVERREEVSADAKLVSLGDGFFQYVSKDFVGERFWLPRWEK